MKKLISKWLRVKELENKIITLQEVVNDNTLEIARLCRIVEVLDKRKKVIKIKKIIKIKKNR